MRARIRYLQAEIEEIDLRLGDRRKRQLAVLNNDAGYWDWRVRTGAARQKKSKELRETRSALRNAQRAPLIFDEPDINQPTELLLAVFSAVSQTDSLRIISRDPIGRQLLRDVKGFLTRKGFFA